MKKTWDEDKQEAIEQLDFETDHAHLEDDDYFQAKNSWLVRKEIWTKLLSNISSDTFSEFKLAILKDRPYTLRVSGLRTPFELFYTKDHELMACFEKDNENWDSIIIIDSPENINSITTETINSSDFYKSNIESPLETWFKSIQDKEIHFCHSGKGVTWVEIKNKV